MQSVNRPMVSVCITTYNQDDYISDCLASVLAQVPGVSLEVLIGDDGTGVQTPFIVKQFADLYPGVIRYFKHEKNLGASKNYQFLVSRAEGLYIAHLDGDDFWLPGKLAVQVRWLEENATSVACYSNAIVVDEGGIVSGVFSSDVGQVIDLEYLLVKGNFLNHSSLLYRSSHKYLVLDISEPFIDYRLHLAFARHGVLGFSNRALVVYRFGTEHSMMRSMSEAVRTMYFEALNSVLKSGAVTEVTRRLALQHFWRVAFLNGARRRDFGMIAKWATRLRSEYPRECFRVVVLGVAGSFRVVGRVLFKKLRKALFRGNDLEVMFER